MTRANIILHHLFILSNCVMIFYRKLLFESLCKIYEKLFLNWLLENIPRAYQRLPTILNQALKCGLTQNLSNDRGQTRFRQIHTLFGNIWTGR